MDKYWVQVDGNSNVPYTKDEIFTRFAGRVTADTPCAKLGENRWGKLSNYFPDWQNPVQETPPLDSGATGTAQAPEAERYPALRTISFFYRIAAFFVGLVAVVGVFCSLLMLDRAGGWILLLGSLIGGFLGVISMLALSEAIRVFLDIEKNTRKPSSEPL